MLIDLKNLRDELAFEPKRDRSTSSDLDVEKDAATSVQPSVVTNSTEAIPTSTVGKRRVAALGIGAVLVTVIGIVGVKMWSPAGPSQQNNPPAVAAERVLNYWVTVQKYRDGKPYQEAFRLPGEMIFEKDYRVRLHFGSPQDGYLYIFNEGPQIDGEAPPLNVLFPSPTANNGSSLVLERRDDRYPKRELDSV